MPRVLKALAPALVTAILCAPFAQGGSDELVAGFRAPPSEARANIWWHWMNGNVSKAGITADLEAMKRVGLGGVQLFDAGLALPRGPVAFDTPDWYDHIVFAAHEAERLGLSFGIANCSGWTSSGGPWITPELGMKVVTNTTISVSGPRHLDVKIAQPEKTNGFYSDIAVVAFPTPRCSAAIPDFDRQVFRLRGGERGPVAVAPIPDGTFPDETCVDGRELVDLTARMSADGRLDWNVPEGKWTILRIGYMANGQRNRPATRNGDGLECDKLSAHALDVHFDAYVGKVAAALKGCKSFDNVLIDSYEVKGQNWTRGFEREFRSRRGYDILPFLPVLAGYPVDSTAETRRFLRDFRRTIADLFAENYAGRMAERCHAIGVKFACEPYGNGPFDDLQYGAMCDIPMSEFWTRRGDGVPMWTRWGHRWRGNARTVASVAHVWGRETVGAEAFTAYPTPTSGRWLEHPYSMKAQGDMVLADGVNRFYFHRYAHQPWTAPVRYPGMTMAFYGSHFERTQTWWENGFKAYLEYLTRVQYMLRRGTFVADVLVYAGDDAPNFGTAGEIPDGWRGDHCSKAAYDRLRRCEDGSVVAPSGLRYRMLARPGDDIAAMLQRRGCARDFVCADRNISWIHRRDGGDEIYFVATASNAASRVACSFRDAAGDAELWDPETGAIRRTSCRRVAGRAEIDLELGPVGSMFVVFRRQPTEGVKMIERRRTVAATDIPGPWSVEFRMPGSDKPFRRELPALSDWTASSDDAVRYFSGTATYATRFVQRGGGRFVLSLGDVRDIAEVVLNGKTFRTLWKPPFELDVTEAVREGENDLSVKVTNRWPNRLIGDERLHADDAKWNGGNRWRRPVLSSFPDWLVAGLPSPAGRAAFSTCKLWRADDQLLPSGLIGPVCLLRKE